MRALPVVCALLLCGFAQRAAAAWPDLGRFTPATLFGQAGIANNSTESYAFGATWDGTWRHHYPLGAVTSFYETSFGRWVTDGGPLHGSGWTTQLGITPGFRLQPAVWGTHWYMEAGVGVNVILPLYRSRTKHFSTEFNFGDHAAVGRLFGVRLQHELAIRFEHFSNAGIDHPNPGENFLQLRYAHRL